MKKETIKDIHLILIHINGVIPTWNKIQLKDINTSKYKIIIDKYDRILDEGQVHVI